MLSKQALDEYREIYRQEHGEVPSDEVLAEEAIKLLTAFDLIYRPVKKVWLKEYERTRTTTGMAAEEREISEKSSSEPEPDDSISTQAA
jgi:hypothetical protein